jgi:4-hydroxybenzoate polyprenyltransferase
MKIPKFAIKLKNAYLIAMIVMGLIFVPMMIATYFLGIGWGGIIGLCIGAMNVLMTIDISKNKSKKRGVMKSEK